MLLLQINYTIIIKETRQHKLIKVLISQKKEPIMGRSETKFKNISIRMNNALLRLLKQKQFSEITVSEICQEAQVNRSTFYSHYTNTLELLNETWKTIQINALEDIKRKGAEIDIKEIDRIDKKELVFISPKFLIPYLTFIKENKDLFLVYIENSSTFSKNTFDNIFENLINPIFKKYNIRDDAVTFYLSKYYLTGVTAIVAEWVRKDCQDDIILICEIIMLAVRPNKY